MLYVLNRRNAFRPTLHRTFAVSRCVVLRLQVQLVWEACHVLLAMLAAAHQAALDLPPDSPAAAVFGATSNSTPPGVQAQGAAKSCPEPETPPVSWAAFLQVIHMRLSIVAKTRRGVTPRA